MNQWVRFERPGHYAVHALSHVRGPQRQDVEVESNQIGIDIVAASPQWQEQELASDLAILNSTLSKIDSASFESRMNAARRLTYLDTPAAVREMARWLGIRYSDRSILQDGLRSSQHGAEAIAAMREFCDLPPSRYLQSFFECCRSRQTIKEPQNALAEVVEQKQGAAKAISIKTLLDNIPAGNVPETLRSKSPRSFRNCPLRNKPNCLTINGKRSTRPK